MNTIFPQYSGTFIEELTLEEIILDKILSGNTFEFKISPNKRKVTIEFQDKCEFTINTDDFYKILIIAIKLVGLNPAKAKKNEYPEFPNDGTCID